MNQIVEYIHFFIDSIEYIMDMDLVKRVEFNDDKISIILDIHGNIGSLAALFELNRDKYLLFFFGYTLYNEDGNNTDVMSYNLIFKNTILKNKEFCLNFLYKE